MSARGYGEAVVMAVKGNRGIAVGVWWNVGLLVLSLAAWPLDRRTILGLNPWVKPLKFELSVLIFLVTVGLMLRALERSGQWRRSVVWMSWGFGVAMIVENTIIAMQSARGVRSHMNFSTLLDGVLFGVMGVFIALNTVLGGWLLALWCVTATRLARVVVWGVRLGLAMLLAGSIEGVRMVLLGGHTVGAPDGGPGLVFLNWSTGHGDLRVAHFFALHALQAMPLAALALAWTRWRERVQMSLLLGFFLMYGFVVWWLFREALSGVSVYRA